MLKPFLATIVAATVLVGALKAGPLPPELPLDDLRLAGGQTPKIERHAGGFRIANSGLIRAEREGRRRRIPVPHRARPPIPTLCN